MKKHRLKVAQDSADEIAAVVDEYLDWKDVYASRIADNMVGVVIFASNFKGDVFIEWRHEKDSVKLGGKTSYNDGTEQGLVAKIVWVDGWIEQS